jgi:hypothetical protein
MAKRPGIMIYFSDWRAAVEELSNAELGQLLKAVLKFAERGQKPRGLSATVNFAFKSICEHIEKDGVKYDGIVLKRQYAAFVHEYPKFHPTETPPTFDVWCDLVASHDNTSYPTTTTIPTATATPTGTMTAGKPPRARPKFDPPSVDEVRAYCQECGNGIDPEYFVACYEARGWKYNGGVPMKDWKAAVRTWEAKDTSFKSSRKGMATALEDYQTPETQDRMRQDMARMESYYAKARQSSP